MQENNDKYTYEEIEGKIVSVEEATEIKKNQKISLRLKIVALCTAVAIGGVAYHKLNDKEETKIGNEVGAFQIDENNEALKKLDSELFGNVDNSSDESLNEYFIKNAFNEGFNAALSKNAEIIHGYENDDTKELREAFEEGYREGLEQYNNQKLEDVNNNSNIINYILIEENRIDGKWYSSKPFITNEIPTNDKDKRYIFAGTTEKDDVIIYEKQKRKVTTTDFENYRIESDWKSTGEYFYSNESLVDTLDTRYLIVGYQSIKDERNYIEKSNLKNSYYSEKSELGTVINIENQNTSEQTLGKVR